MLAVCAGFAEQNRTGCIGDGLAVFGNAFAVGFHVGLLQIGGQAVQILVVRQNGIRFRAEEIMVPYAQNA